MKSTIAFKFSYTAFICGALLTAASCGAQRGPIVTANPLIPSDGGNITPSGNTVANSLVVTNPSVDFSKAVQEVGSVSEEITFAVSTGTISNFNVDFDSASQQSGDWTLTKPDSCSSTLTLTTPCKITVTFAPKNAAQYNTSLAVSYTNNLNIVTSTTVSLFNKTNAALLQTPYVSKISASTLNNSISSTLVGDFLLTLGKDNSFTAADFKETPVFTKGNVNTSSIVVFPKHSPSTFFFTDTLQPSSTYIVTLPIPVPPTPLPTLDPSIYRLASGISHMYGVDRLGNIFSINANGSLPTNKKPIFSFNTGTMVNVQLSVDPSDKALYGIYRDQTSSYSLYYVNFSSPTFITSKPADLAFAQAILLGDTQEYVFTYDGSNTINHIFAFDKNNNLNLTFDAQVNLMSDSFLPPIYNSADNTIYFVTSDKKNSSYNLNAVDGSTGVASIVFPSSEPLSAPFLTSGTSTSQSKVIVVSESGKVMAFSKDVASAEFKPFVFNSGKTFYQIPGNNVTFYPKLVTLYNGTLLIPTYNNSTSTQNNYPLFLGW